MFAFLLLGALGGLCAAAAFYILGASIWVMIFAYVLGEWISLAIYVAMAYRSGSRGPS